MTERPDNLQVVADEQVRQAPPRLQVPKQVDHLRLDRAIQRGGWLVQEQEPGLKHQRPSDGDALTLASGELVRVAMPRLRVNVHLLQGLNDTLVPRLWRPESVDFQSLRDNLRD